MHLTRRAYRIVADRIAATAARAMADFEHCLHDRPANIPWQQLADEARAAIAQAAAAPTP